MTGMIHYDCRFYVGRKPCKFRRACEGCNHHDPIEQKILIIKLGALGDLLRTTSIITSLKAKYPRSQITWVTTKACLPLLKNLPELDRIFVTDSMISTRILAENYDIMINFDKDSPAVELATISKASVKKGFGLSPAGAIIALNEGSQYALEMGIDDHLKFKINKKTYQQIIHDMADFPSAIHVPPYLLRLTELESRVGKRWLDGQVAERDTRLILGCNPGAGRVFATKKWHAERYLELMVRLHQEYGVIPALFGGSDEIEVNDRIYEGLRAQGVGVIRPGEALSMRQFVSLVAHVDGMICGDTLAMHVALAFKRPTVALFTSTCVQEIEMYGVGTAIVGKASCAPCYLSQCKQPSQYCADDITVDQVFETVVQHMGLGQREKLRRSSNV